MSLTYALLSECKTVLCDCKTVLCDSTAAQCNCTDVLCDCTDVQCLGSGQPKSYNLQTLKQKLKCSKVGPGRPVVVSCITQKMHQYPYKKWLLIMFGDCSLIV